MFSIVQYTPVTYGNGYQYPDWAEILGICISLSSMLWIPLYTAYYIFTTPGTLREVIILTTIRYILSPFFLKRTTLGFNQRRHAGI